MSKNTAADQADDPETRWPGLEVIEHAERLGLLEGETHALKQAVDHNSQCIEALKAGALALLALRGADIERINALEARLAQVESHALTFGKAVAGLQERMLETQRQVGELVRQFGETLRAINGMDGVDPRFAEAASQQEPATLPEPAVVGAEPSGQGV